MTTKSDIRRRIERAWGQMAPKLDLSPSEQADEIAAGRMEPPRKGWLMTKAEQIARRSMAEAEWKS